MAITREMLGAMGLDAAQIEAVIGEHEAVARERDELRGRLDALSNEKGWREEFERLERDFNAYRAGVEARRADAARQAAYRRLLRDERIPERFHDRILRLSQLDALELDGDRLRDEQAVREAVRRDWGDYIAVDQIRGVPVDTPPAFAGPARPTVEQIMAIPDDAARQRSIAENHVLFGF